MLTVKKASGPKKQMRQTQTHRFCHGLGVDSRPFNSATARRLVGGMDVRGKATTVRAGVGTDQPGNKASAVGGSCRHGVHLGVEVQHPWTSNCVLAPGRVKPFLLLLCTLGS